MARSSTARKQAVAKIGDNIKAMVPFTADLVSSFCTSAFDADDQAGKSKQSANQFMSAAIIGHRALLVADGADIAPLKDCVTDEQKRKDMIETMVAKFCVALPDQNVVGAAAYAAASVKRTSHMALVRRSVMFAGVLDMIDAKATDFNSQIGYWSVRASCLFEPNVTMLDALAEPGAMVLLDNRAYGAFGKTTDGKQKLVRVNASIEQVKRIAVPSLGRGATNGDSPVIGKPLKDIGVEVLAGEHGLTKPVAIRTLHALLTKDKTSDIRAASWGMTPDDWNLLADIAKINDEIQDSPAFRASMIAKQKADAQS